MGVQGITIGDRLRQVRLARGISLDELSAEMGRAVTRQSLWKYEQGKALPSAATVAKLAAALHVPAPTLWREPAHTVRFIAYRRGCGLRKRDARRVEATVSLALEERLRLKARLGQFGVDSIPERRYAVGSMEDAEKAAEALRDLWDLGRDPVSSVVEVLENHGVHVIEIDAPEKFDGISAVVYDEAGIATGAAVATRRGIAGDRQRLDLVHELGHLVLDVCAALDEEKAAFRFGGALLAPADTLRREVGTRRTHVQLAELRLLKRRFGMSLQAVLRRLRDIDIITESHYRQWCIQINQLGYRKEEPDRLPPEQPVWLRQIVLRATAEGLIGRDEAERLLGETMERDEPLSLVEKRAIMKLPINERRRILAGQAAKAASVYEADSEWRDLQGGDIVDY